MVDLFDGIVGIDAVTAAKPDPAHLIEAVQAVGGDLTHSIMVGDADTDAGTARAAGTPLILVDFGYTEIPAVDLAPDILLHHFDDLVEACTHLLNKSLPAFRSVEREYRALFRGPLLNGYPGFNARISGRANAISVGSGHVRKAFEPNLPQSLCHCGRREAPHCPACRTALFHPPHFWSGTIGSIFHRHTAR
jgi:hypothetical protein